MKTPGQRSDHIPTSQPEPVLHLIVLVRGTQLSVSGAASSAPEKLPYKLPAEGAAGLNQYEIVGLAKAMEKRYGKALSQETTWSVITCTPEPWPPVRAIEAAICADGTRMGLLFTDESKYQLDIGVSDPSAFREISWCAVTRATRQSSSEAQISQESLGQTVAAEETRLRLVEFRLPAGWVCSGKVWRPTDAWPLPSSEGIVFSPAIQFMAAPIMKDAGDTQEFVNGWFDKGSQNLFENFELVMRGPTQIGHCPASWFEFTFDKLTRRWQAIALVISDGKAVNYLDGAFLMSDHSKWYQVVRDALLSVRISR